MPPPFHPNILNISPLLLANNFKHLQLIYYFFLTIMLKLLLNIFATTYRLLYAVSYFWLLINIFF